MNEQRHPSSPPSAGGGMPGGSGARHPKSASSSFWEDFRKLFVRGLAALLPTLITLSIFFWIWSFLWESLGKHIIWVIRQVWFELQARQMMKPTSPAYIWRYWSEDLASTKIVGVGLAIILVYIVGFFLGNLIGRTFLSLLEQLVMKIPIIRAIYPAAKQVTEFVLVDRGGRFSQSRVVAVQPHEKGIWSIGLVTGPGLAALSDKSGQEMVTVFVPSSPTAFSGYVLVVPRSGLVELPLSVEEAMRLLISGGVVMPGLPGQAEPAGREIETSGKLQGPGATSPMAARSPE